MSINLGIARLWLLVVGAALAAASGSSTAETPNIVFIMADDLGYGQVGAYGQQFIRTPNIDRLAVEGMRFTDAYSGATVCAPSRSVLMSGLHGGHAPVRANGGGNPIQPGDTTVADVLKDAGYRTGGFGKWGLGDIGTAGVPWRHGFDEFFGYLHQVHAHFYYPEYLWKNDQKYVLPGNAEGKRRQYTHDEITEQALDFVRKNAGREPFFLYVPYTIPHLEYLVPEDSLAEYRGQFKEVEFRHKHYADTDEPFAALAGMVTRMDRDIGRLMDLLVSLDIDKETVVFFTSDNGGLVPNKRFDVFASNGPLRGGKGNLYEGGIRVPMIVRWPGRIAPGSASDLPTAFQDFLPTAGELAGAETPAGLDGVSIVPTLLGETQPAPQFLYWEHPGARLKRVYQAVRSGHWKAIRDGADQPLELYNLDQDLGETTDVAESHPDVVSRIEDFLKTARSEPRPHYNKDWMP
jgi:arylsulfatase A